MSKSAFTAGPWDFHPLRYSSGAHDGLGYIRPREEDGMEIAHHGDTGRSESENLANARLIAAAPEMYEALIQARGALHLDHMVDESGNSFGTTVVAIDAIDAALAKAEGRS